MSSAATTCTSLLIDCVSLPRRTLPLSSRGSTTWSATLPRQSLESLSALAATPPTSGLSTASHASAGTRCALLWRLRSPPPQRCGASTCGLPTPTPSTCCLAASWRAATPRCRAGAAPTCQCPGHILKRCCAPAALGCCCATRSLTPHHCVCSQVIYKRDVSWQLPATPAQGVVLLLNGCHRPDTEYFASRNAGDAGRGREASADAQGVHICIDH